MKLLLSTLGLLCSSMPAFVAGRLGGEHPPTKNELRGLYLHTDTHTNRGLKKKKCDDGLCNRLDPDKFCRCEGGEGAYAKIGQDCHASFQADCLCKTGYMMTSDKCIFCNHDNRDAWCQEEGGSGAYAKDGQACYDSFAEDCVCKEGYMMTSDGCIFCNHDNRDAWCQQEGGQGAVAKNGQVCYDNFDEDCVCKTGYMMTNDGCIFCNHDNRDAWCQEEGGAGAYAKDGQVCYDDFDEDCLCRDGYRLHKSGCEYCNMDNPDTWCGGEGGEGAYAIPNLDCYVSFKDDCSCREGYIKGKKGCERDCHGKDPDAWCRSTGGEGAFAREDVTCWDLFNSHCDCYDGFEQTETACTPTAIGPRIPTQIQHVGNNGQPVTAYPMKECQGDCDIDDDCEGSLLCFQRDGNTAVPGCQGGENEANDYDYCYDPSSPLPTLPPTTLPPTTLPPTTLPPITLPPLIDEGHFNTTYTVYEFVGEKKVVEAGCSFAQTGVVAACMGGEISLVGVSDPLIVCGEAKEYEDGNSRLSCPNTCSGDVCQGVILVPTVSEVLTKFWQAPGTIEFGEVHFLCESSDTSFNQSNAFVCGPSGIVMENNSSESESLYNVGRDKDFRWGFVGPDLCNRWSTISEQVDLSAARRNPDLDEP